MTERLETKINECRERLAAAYQDMDNFSMIAEMARRHPDVKHLMPSFEDAVEGMGKVYSGKLAEIASELKGLLSNTTY
jgi:hypothetical protein